jgi:hypothetical protein
VSNSSCARISEPLSCCFSGNQSKPELVEHLPNLLAQSLHTKDVSHNLVECCNNLRIFGLWFLSYEFLFATARTLCHYVCELASSSNIQLCLCAHDYPALPNMRKWLLLFYHVSGDVLILKFNLQWWFLLSTCYLHRLVFPSNPFVIKHVEALRCS